MQRRFFTLLVRGSCLVLGIGLLGTFVRAQDSGASTPSLGELARKTRAQHETAPGQPNKAQELVDDMQAEEEASANAPTGYKSYDAGDYRLFVPYPYSLEGRDNGGAVLLGSRVGVSNTEVWAGEPIPIDPSKSEAEMLFWVRQLANLHGSYPNCSASKLGEHKAFRCSYNGSPYLLGHQVAGGMLFVLGSDRLYPVMCVSPDELNKPETSAQTRARFNDESNTYKVCDQIVYPSIQLKEDIVVHPAKIAEGTPAKAGSEQAKAAPAPAKAAPDTAVAAAGGQAQSLGDVARQARQAPHAKPQAKLDNSEGASSAPAGFQSFSVQFCFNPQACGEAAVVIPEKAEVLSRANAQYVFKTVQNGSPVMLYAGLAMVEPRYGQFTDADFRRIRDIADAKGWSQEKPDGVSTQEMTIEGLPALMTRFRYQREAKVWWIGERTLIDLDGAQFLVGCTAPEDHFADAEMLCTTLVNSLRFP